MDIVGSAIAASLITATAALCLWLVSRTLWRISRLLGTAAGAGSLLSWLLALRDEFSRHPVATRSWLDDVGAPRSFVQIALVAAAVLAIVWAPVLLIGHAAPGKPLRSAAAAWAGVLWAGFLVTAVVAPAWQVTGICLPPGELVGGLGKDGRLIQDCVIVPLYVFLGLLALVVLYLTAFAALARRHFLELRVRPGPHHYRSP